MYKIKEIPEQQFKEFEVPKETQEEVIFYYGKPLDPLAAYELLKKETKGFMLASAQAEEVDSLLYELLYPSKVPSQKQVKKRVDTLKKSKKGLARTALLLKLRLRLQVQLAAQKQSA